jgi:chromate transport protein ChrA
MSTETATVNLPEWVWVNLVIGATSFGGSGRSLLYHEHLVARRHWLTDAEFRECLVLAQALPGPNLVNLCAYIGARLFGYGGGIAAVLALSLPGTVLGVGLIAYVTHANRVVQVLLEGCAVVGVGLFLSFIMRLLEGLVRDRERSYSWIVVVLVVGGLSCCNVGVGYLLVFGVSLGLVLERIGQRYG